MSMQRGVTGSVMALVIAAAPAGCGGEPMRLSPSFVAVHNTMTAMGFVQSGEISEGSLPEGAVARFTTSLRGGDCYTFVAFGGEGVRDIDVAVLDETGTEVAADRTQDARAAAQFCPDFDGEYQVAVRMASGNGGYVVSSWSGMPRGGGAVAAGGGRGTCRSPLPITIGTPVRGDTSNGTHAMAGSCIRGGDAPEIVYALTLERRAQVSAVINTSYDGALYLLGSCGEMRSEIACNDDAPHTGRSQVDATLDPGTYYLVVDGYADEAGEYELMVEATDLQNVSQVCASAPALVPGHPVTGSTAGQPNYFTATCAGGARSPDRVYTLDVPSRSRVRLRMQSTYDGAVYIRSDCQNPNSELACNDDHRDTRHAMIVTTLDPGRYYVYADGYSAGNAGDYSLGADVVPLTGGGAPADACTAPGQAVPGQDLVIDTFPATDDLSGSCGGQGAPDVVYRVDVPSRARFRARVSDAEFTPVLYLQRACGQSSTEVICGVLSGAGTELDTLLTPGQYFLVVDGVAQDHFGAARVEVQLQDLAPLEQACQQAPRLRPGRTVTGDTSSSRDRFQASCAGGARSNDLVYQLVLTRRSRVRIRSTQQYDGAIYIRSSCTDPSTEVACNDDTTDNRHSEVEAVLDRGTYYVFVDGYADRSQGSFTLDVDVSSP